jgi:hypothetical protein
VSETVRVRLTCSTCQTKTTAVYDSSLGKLKVKLEHLDEDVHNLVPFSEDGSRGNPALVTAPELDQQIHPWMVA